MENNSDNIKKLFIEKLKESVGKNTFVKITLSKYVGREDNLKNIYVKKVIIKNSVKFSFTYRYKTKDVVKNYVLDEALNILQDLLETEFKLVTLFTIASDYVYEFQKNNNFIFKELLPSIRELPSLEHDKKKNRKLETNSTKKYLQLLSLIDSNGNIIPKSQDKFKQINHYIEILSPLLSNFRNKEKLNIVDMGSGKGYLTFALYDYLANNLKLKTNIIGVETRKDLVNFCNKIVEESNFKGLNFVENNIKDFDTGSLDVLIALHACDTATDDAICKGINSGAELIVVAPCCHKQIRKEIEKSETKNIISSVIKYGIFLEREAELITDTIRAMVMEYFGYKTKIVEFISDAHTHKNIMIIGEKSENLSSVKRENLNKIKELKRAFGIDYHYLEREMNIC